ncbi:TPA: hypothetical protein HA219_01075 [Candidatus Woesearchaeota archaeon]|nr:hypothetical protein [Candidatus Woesearchaeota archaeon]HIH39299.1 hypothetical protein [Candidatus Woesearchaeota archaeon]
MDLVIDANILFAALIKKGKTEELLFKDNLHIFAPEFIFEEFEKYSSLILEKTERSKEEFEKLIEILRKRIKIISSEETEEYLIEAIKICPDKKDTDYFALALKMNCAIWSNDNTIKAKQNRIDIYSTEDLMKLI